MGHSMDEGGCNCRGFTGKVALKHRAAGRKELPFPMSRGRTFPVEGIAGARALGRKHGPSGMNEGRGEP